MIENIFHSIMIVILIYLMVTICQIAISSLEEFVFLIVPGIIFIGTLVILISYLISIKIKHK